MSEPACPNLTLCKLVNNPAFPIEEEKRQAYLEKYCHQNKASWGTCARYTTRMELFFCPDFVIPDTKLTIREILEKFDEMEFGIIPKKKK